MKMNTQTIQATFDPKSLPRWAQNDAAVVAKCRISLSFRCDVFSATTKQMQNFLKRKANS